MNLISAGENPASSDNICPNCECALSAEWPDLSQRTEWSFRKIKDYLKASDLGCSLCSMVVAILRDARERATELFMCHESTAKEWLFSHDVE